MGNPRSACKSVNLRSIWPPLLYRRLLLNHSRLTWARVIRVGVEELRDDVHDDAEKRQIERRHARAALGRSVARIHVVRRQKTTHQIHGLSKSRGGGKGRGKV